MNEFLKIVFESISKTLDKNLNISLIVLWLIVSKLLDDSGLL